MNINDLKVGDRIKYYTTSGQISEGVISDINGQMLEISHNNLYKLYETRLDLVISKLDEVKTYKETFIERKGIHTFCLYWCHICNKEYGETTSTIKIPKMAQVCESCSKNWSQIQRIQNYSWPIAGQPIPETSYHCPKCNKKLWGTCGYPIKQYSNDICCVCKVEEYKQNFLNKKINVIKGKHRGKSGIVTAIWHDGDDCSGSFRRYLISLDNKDNYTNCFGINIEDCEIIQEKNVPKSFKFDVSFVNRIEFNQKHTFLRHYPFAFFTIEGGQIDFHPDNPKNFLERLNGKKYTIEIKEKE